MHIREIMTENVTTVRGDATLQEVAAEMKSLDIGALPVYEGDRLTGIITDRDIVIRSTVKGQDPASVTANEVMTPQLDVCFEDQALGEVTAVMKRDKIRRMPVMDRQKNLIGIISLADIVLRGNKGEAADLLAKVSRQD